MDRSGGEPDSPHEDPGGERPDPLAAARRRARQRIDDERRRHPEDLRPVFEALAARLFEPGFNPKTAVPDRAARGQFRLTVGVTLRAYCDRQLLDAALKLVRETTLPILEIAAGLGFEDPELFAKWFRWRTGKAPTSMRPATGEQRDPPKSPAPPVAGGSSEEPWTVPEYRQAAAWDMSPELGAVLIREVRELYPELDDPPPTTKPCTGDAPCSTSNRS